MANDPNELDQAAEHLQQARAVLDESVAASKKSFRALALARVARVMATGLLLVNIVFLCANQWNLHRGRAMVAVVQAKSAELDAATWRENKAAIDLVSQCFELRAKTAETQAKIDELTLETRRMQALNVRGRALLAQAEADHAVFHALLVARMNERAR